jgi:hypothetical protein
MTSPTVNSLTGGITIGQLHNDDGALGGSTSPPFEIDLQPHDNMSIYVANLTGSAAQSGSTFYSSTTVKGKGLSYYQVYADSNPIVRGHSYAMQIDAKYTVLGDNTGFV